MSARIKPKISVVLPSSLTAEERSLLHKTIKIGFVGRALAIFRVNEVVIYSDRPSAREDGTLIAEVLRYMEAPQYLRKRLFPLRGELQYVGTLPPLRTPHHPLESKEELLAEGSYREGMVLESGGRSSLVDIGTDTPIRLSNAVLPRGTRVTVRILKVGNRFEGTLAKVEEAPLYWGYKVVLSMHPLGETLRRYGGDLLIATSRYGVKADEALRKMGDRWSKSEKVTIAFGSPYEGLREILEREKLQMNKAFDFTINAIPTQGTKTVRTEEAIYSTLALVNSFVGGWPI